ncbi:MAG TPA: exodeoxyribonuclease VII large subunit [Candidatus Binatia bacterium]|nr:exodeoxyribonuclease VII large subunit [Candidatus Binatia bacterium]
MNVFSVSQFVEFLNTALATAVFPEGVVIEGEVVEYRVSQQKWIWFKLKDESAVAECFATVWQLRQPLEDGMMVRAYGVPKVHPKSGKFSVTIERVELVGEGALRRAFELMRRKLEAEGLFDLGRKRAIPRFPERIGLIASKESAAYGDFMRILKNRWGGMEIKLIDVAVQGRDAVAEITAAFRWFNDNSRAVDVLVLTRGGGSMEDLQAFNSEEVARAVFSSAVPVVVGVGHERDETLADYAADVRASTPTNAAERLVPDRREVLSRLEGAVRGMDSSMRAALSGRAHQVDALAGRIEAHARHRIDEFRHLLKDFGHRFDRFAAAVRERSQACDAIGRLLATLDPRRPLEKGYAIVRGPDGIVKDAAAVDAGATLEIQLRKGRLGAKATGRT